MRKTVSTVLVNLTERETQGLNELAIIKAMTPEQAMLQALRFYDLITRRQLKGEQMAFLDKDGNVIKEPVYGCMGD